MFIINQRGFREAVQNSCFAGCVWLLTEISIKVSLTAKGIVSSTNQ